MVFLVFVVLSTFAWFLRALSEIYVADVRYPVEYINFPVDKYLNHNPPKKLILRIKADGFTILNSKLMPKKKLPFDVKSFALNTLESDSSTVYILTRYAREFLSSELSKKKNVEILFISPDTIYFHFSQLLRKKVAVKPVIDKSVSVFRQQYMLNGPILSIPDSVIVIGPDGLIDSLTFAYTEMITVKDLTDTLEKNYRLKKISSLDYNYKKVKVIIPVDRFTESSFEVPLTMRNVPDSFKIMKIFPKNVRISFQVALSRFNQVTADQFKPYLDFSSIDPEIDSRVTVSLESVPEHISAIKIDPRNIEFLFKKTDEENRDNGEYREW